MVDPKFDAVAAHEDASAGKAKIVAMLVTAGTQEPKTATITVKFRNGKTKTAQAAAVGPISATIQALKKLIPHEAELVSYRARANGDNEEGSIDLANAEAEVVVCLQIDGHKYRGTARDVDSNLAFAFAYLGALNQRRRMTK